VWLQLAAEALEALGSTAKPKTSTAKKTLGAKKKPKS